MYKLYWIRASDHDDPYSQGYIGITRRKLQQRLSEHITRRPDIDFSNLYIEVLHEGTKEEISHLESKYRPNSYIGWNRSKGGLTGGRPHGISTFGWKHSEKARKERSIIFAGSNNPYAKSITIENNLYLTGKEAAIAYNVSASTISKYRRGLLTLDELKNNKKYKWDGISAVKARNNVRKYKWYNNGEKEIYILKNEKIPDGFSAGRLKKKGSEEPFSC